MLSQPTQIVKNVILLVVLLCVLTFCTACSTPTDVGTSVDSASRQPAHDAAISEAQPVEDELVSSVFNSSGAKTQYTLGEAFDETGLFYSVLNRPQNAGSDWDFILYDLKSGNSTTLASGPNAYTYHALMLNGSIVVYTWSGDVSFRNPAAPIITTKEFTLPVEMRSGDTAGCRMVCAGDLLALNDGQQNIYLVNENNAVQAVLQADGSNAPEPASHAASDSDWEQVYGQFLSEYAQSLPSIDYTDHYALYDITGDGIPELFLMQQLEAGSPFDAYFIYTTDGASAVPLGQVPGTAYSLCPADGSGFLAVMQYMFCETVILYTYENGALHEQALLNEVPADKLPRNASTPLDETGYHILTRFQTYSVDDLSGLTESGISSGSNQALVALLQS